MAPINVAADKKENLYLAEPVNNRIRRVDAHKHIITTIAGTGKSGNGGDGGRLTKPIYIFPAQYWPILSANIFIADTYNNKIRKIDARRISSLLMQAPDFPV